MEFKSEFSKESFSIIDTLPFFFSFELELNILEAEESFVDLGALGGRLLGLCKPDEFSILNA